MFVFFVYAMWLNNFRVPSDVSIKRNPTCVLVRFNETMNRSCLEWCRLKHNNNIAKSRRRWILNAHFHITLTFTTCNTIGIIREACLPAGHEPINTLTANLSLSVSINILFRHPSGEYIGNRISSRMQTITSKPCPDNNPEKKHNHNKQTQYFQSPSVCARQSFRFAHPSIDISFINRLSMPMFAVRMRPG